MPARTSPLFSRPLGLVAVLLLSAVATLTTIPQHALALTDGDRTTVDPAAREEPETLDTAGDEDEGLDDVSPGMPMPGGLIEKNPVAKDEAPRQEPDTADQTVEPAEIILDPNQLPEAVRKLRVAIVEAAASGDIERLRPLLQTGTDATLVAVGDAPEDPIQALKSLSGDPEGREVLGILLDIISTSAARVDKGTPNELYVWPYFAEKSLETLSAPEIVELYRIVTASDVKDMKEFGSYNFYRIGIDPTGKWKFFVAGD